MHSFKVLLLLATLALGTWAEIVANQGNSFDTLQQTAQNDASLADGKASGSIQQGNSYATNAFHERDGLDLVPKVETQALPIEVLSNKHRRDVIDTTRKTAQYDALGADQGAYNAVKQGNAYAISALKERDDTLDDPQFSADFLPVNVLSSKQRRDGAVHNVPALANNAENSAVKQDKAAVPRLTKVRRSALRSLE
jgi:hypothetical protein